MLKRLLFAATVFGSIAPATAEPPKLLVVISVDQLSADLFDEYRPQFTGGLSRLSQGTVFRNGYQGHATTETCPGHSTILTGARPARTGIIANDWMDPSAARKDKTIYCAEDERAPGSTSDHYTVSPVHLRVPTLGELMSDKWRASRTVAVAGKDRSAVMMSGQRPNQRWYWKDSRFVTDLIGVSAPRSIAPTNTAIAGAVATAREPLESPPFCRARSAEVAVEGSSRKVGGGRFGRAAGDTDGFHDSPEFDAATLALAAALTSEMRLGQANAPDLLAISLSASDYVGHRYGPGGQEMCLQLLSLDRDLAGFFQVLDRAGLDYAVALTADHGGQDIPERLRQKGIAAERVDANLAAGEIGRTVAAKLGLKESPLSGGYSNVYVNRNLSAATREVVIAEALAAYRAHPQVEAAFSAHEVRATSLPTGAPDAWSLIERARASFDPQRSGDITVLLRRNVTPIRKTTGSVATHGSPWDYDRRVPILFWRAGMPATNSDAAIETVDIMPTLAAMIGLPLRPGSVDGRCLLAVPDAHCPPR
ncbi:MAG: alkaline phosphatase family protein [Sphingomicrobium sp.]